MNHSKVNCSEDIQQKYRRRDNKFEAKKQESLDSQYRVKDSLTEAASTNTDDAVTSDNSSSQTSTKVETQKQQKIHNPEL